MVLGRASEVSTDREPYLALFNPQLETTVSTDASSYGLGAVLLQKQSAGDIRPVAYISRSMSPTEQSYAQIEKEALALTWACERFADYLIGISFHIQTDHKPLVPLLSTKLLDELPIRVQRFRMRLMRYDFTYQPYPRQGSRYCRYLVESTSCRRHITGSVLARGSKCVRPAYA